MRDPLVITIYEELLRQVAEGDSKPYLYNLEEFAENDEREDVRIDGNLNLRELAEAIRAKVASETLKEML